jgi:hypothetical protein
MRAGAASADDGQPGTYNPRVDLVTVATLALFAAGAVGGLVGVLVGWLTRFAFGLGVGLLILGGVCLWFAGRCLFEYRDFLHAGPRGVWGEVVAIEDRPVEGVLSGTQPVPVVRFAGEGDKPQTIYGPRSGSYKVGDAVSVIVDPVDPARSRVGQLGQLRGGAIAMMLFGTFPFSFGVWMLASGISEVGARGPRARRRQAKPAEPGSSRWDRIVLATLFLAMLVSILWIGYGRGPIGQRFAEGFGAAAATLLGYAIWGAFSDRVGGLWSFGLAVLALNFAVWAFALYLLL